MNDKLDKELFKAERLETDNSLIAERAKATDSLNTANTKSQVKTDKIVKDERHMADQQTATSRAAHDENRETSANPEIETAAGVQLAEERRQTDIATGLARTQMDLALGVERKNTSTIVAKFLEQERIATDRNLLFERDTTDHEFVDSATLLETERASHKKTQGTLTSREEFLAIVSHDLRNPIGAVASYAELILDGAGDTILGPETKQFVQAIKRNAEISLRLIADLLDLERIAENKLIVTLAKCDANLIAQAALDIFLPIAAEKEITLQRDGDLGEIPIECDHDRVLQVVSNLIGNALKYTPQGGTVDFSVRQSAKAIEFAVKDTGPGIPAEKQKEIFLRFAQLESIDRTGLGLGLYIAKSIAEAHAGQLSVESESGFGSTFRLTLPQSH